MTKNLMASGTTTTPASRATATRAGPATPAPATPAIATPASPATAVPATALWQRREFLKTTAAAAGALGLGVACTGSADSPSTPSPMSILILGGTGFIGPHMVDYAMARGHTLTLFNRGRTNTHLFPDVEKLVGDRADNLTALEGRTWDAVIDNSGFIPRHVRESAALLADSGRYAFVSSISAYKDLATPGITEDYEVARLEDPAMADAEEWDGSTYGPFKALCEEAVQEVFGDRANIVRPGYIVGPRDGTDRWTYWPVRAAAGGDVAVPGNPTDAVQFIDARDLAQWVVRMMEDGVGGVFNGVGPAEQIDMATMLEACREVSGSDAVFHWMDDDEFVQEQGAFFPIWAPSDGDFAAVHLVSNAAAVGAGYASRPVADTIRDTLAWWNDEALADRPDGMRAGLRTREMERGPVTMEAMREAEQALLEAWGARDA